MKWRGWGFVALAALGGCTNLLGDFTASDGGATDGAADATLDVGSDGPGSDVVTLDAPKDAPKDSPPDGPACGAVNQTCCANNVCNGSMCCGSTCLDTNNDPKNCGSCAHDCLGATCKNGLCQPQALFTGKSPLPGRIRDAMSNLVWMDRDLTDGGGQTGSVYVCSKQQCTPTAIVSGLDSMNDFVLDAPQPTTVYMSAGILSLYSCAIGGCNQAPTQTSIGSTSGPGGLAYRNGTIYSTLNLDAYQFAPDGGSQVELGSGNEPASEFEAPPNSQYIYWNAGPSGGFYLSFGRDGVADSSAKFWTSNAQSIGHVASDASFVAWSVYNGSGQDIYTCPVGGAYCNNPTPIATGVQLSYIRGGLGMDPTNDEVLWLTVPTQKEVKAYACAAASCNNPKLVADVATNGFATAGAIIADPKFYYFTMADGSTDSLYRVAK